MCKFLMVGAIAILLLSAHPVMAAGNDAANVQVISIAPGLGNRYRAQAFFPVVVELAANFESDSGVIRITTDSADENIPQYVMPFDLTPGTRYRFVLYPFCSDVGGSFKVFIEDARRRVLHEENLTMNSAEPRTYLVGTVGVQGIPGIASRTATDSGALGVEIARIVQEYMPSRPCGYDVVDAIVWAHPDPEGLSPAQAGALYDWVVGGGRIVLAFGDSWQNANSTLLARLLPGRVTGVATSSEIDALVASGGKPFQRDEEIVLAVLQDPSGEVLMSAGGLPLVVKKKVGFGEVIFLAFDPTRNPFAQWAGAEHFWDSLFGLEASDVKQDESSPSGNNFMYGGSYGYGLQARLVGAMNQFDKIKPINFAFIVGFLIIYVLLVGPVDYFVLKRLKHLEWTWVTFPLIAISATVVAFVVISSSRAALVYINQLTVADYSADGVVMRARNISALISPRNHRYDVSFAAPGCELYVAGSADRTYSPFSIASTTYQVADMPDSGMAALDMLLPVWSPRTYCGFDRNAVWSPPPLSIVLEGSPDDLKGAVTNNSSLGMENVEIITKRGVYRIGAVPPGSTGKIGGKRTMTYEDYVAKVTNVSSGGWYSSGRLFVADAEGIVKAASFSEDARFCPRLYWDSRFESNGSNGSRIVNDMPPEISLCHLIESGQAVVLARSRGCVSPLDAGVVSPVRENWTLHRICLALPAIQAP